MASANDNRRWQASQRKLLAEIDRLDKEHASILANADKVRDFQARKQMWLHAQRIEDRVDKLKGRLRRLRAKELDQKQPSLFDS